MRRVNKLPIVDESRTTKMNIVASLLLSALTYAVSNGCDTVLTEAGACCVFPFEYNGEKHCECTSNNWFRPWCSLTPFYAGKWGHCPDDQATTSPPTSSGCNTVETKEGDCCHFPFEYKGETYCGCTSNNWIRPWCSLTPIYEGLWGHCPDNQPTTTPPVGTTTAPPTTSDTTTTTTPPVGTTTSPPTTSDNQPTTAPPVVTTAAPPPPTTSATSCGSRSAGTRIVGGTQAQNGSWPWQAMLAHAGGSQFCGGSIILEQWVLTAAQCVSGKSPSQIVVRMGAYKITDIAQELQVEKIIVHESFYPDTLAHDIALLKLKTKATLGTSVGLVCLPLPEIDPGKTCYITGWGTLEEWDGTSPPALPDYLQEASVPIVAKDECISSYSKVGISVDGPSMICAGFEEGGVDACLGDSGGPLVCESNGKWYLEGVTSWGYGCATKGYYGVYANVRYLTSWVYENIIE
ncbi:serine protease 33-like isoform X1 [Oculina patagonica]